MIGAAAFVEALDGHDVAFFAGVPCSHLDGPIRLLTQQGRYLPAANEGAALALAAGAVAGGQPAAVFAQNSGFGNLVNPLTSLLMPYSLPVLTVMSLRGWPDPANDEPQHAVMGMATHAMLDALGVVHETLTPGSGEDDLRPALAKLAAELAARRPAFLLVARGALMAPAPATAPVNDARPNRGDVIAAALQQLPGALIVSTTGYVSRELFAMRDTPQAFYMQGSMGHASAFALGVACATGSRRPVLLLDGDGAALMHLGSMATVATVAPASLVHVLLDNGSYESTGGQSTTVRPVNFAAVGHALGYRSAADCHDLPAVRAALRKATAQPGPALVVARTRLDRGTAPPRATASVPAPVIATRFLGEAVGVAR